MSEPYCFDTNICVGRPRAFEDDGAYLSSVVAMEVIASADPPELKGWELVWTTYQKRGRLLVPTPEDWWESAKALNRLHYRAKRANQGQAPKLTSEERLRLWNDILIAVSARRAGVSVVTDNLKDFALIQSVCRVKFVSGDEFFLLK